MKIGKADCVESRMHQIGRDNFDRPNGVVFEVASRAVAFNVERILQRAFSRFHIDTVSLEEDGATEWFESSCQDLVLRFATENAALLGLEFIILNSGQGPRLPLRPKLAGAPPAWIAARAVRFQPTSGLSAAFVYEDYRAWCRHELCAELDWTTFWLQIAISIPAADSAIETLEEGASSSASVMPLTLGTPQLEGPLLVPFGGTVDSVPDDSKLAERFTAAGTVAAWLQDKEIVLATASEFWPSREAVYSWCLAWCREHHRAPPTPRGFIRALKGTFPTLHVRTNTEGDQTLGLYWPGNEFSGTELF